MVTRSPHPRLLLGRRLYVSEQRAPGSQKMIWDLFSRHLFILRSVPLGHVKLRYFCEAAGKWKSSITRGVHFLAPGVVWEGGGATCIHRPRSGMPEGDRDRQLTKNNMCLTQPRIKGSGRKSRRAARKTSENMRAGEMKVTLYAAVRGCSMCSQPALTPTRR